MSVETIQAPVDLESASPLQLGLDEMRQRLARLESEIDTAQSARCYPEWWNYGSEELIAVVPTLKEESTPPEAIAEYIDIRAKDQELQARIYGRDNDTHPFTSVAYSLGEEVVGKALQREAIDGKLHSVMLEALEHESAKKHGNLATGLDVLKAAYGLETRTALLGIGGDEFSDKLRPLLQNEKVLGWMRHQDQERDYEFSWAETQEASRQWMSSAVAAATGMSVHEASNYVFSASRNGNDEDLSNVLGKFDKFGVSRIRAISEATGIYGLEAYTNEQLERMESLFSGSNGAAEALAQHDVIAVMVNRMGDHNGIMKDVAHNYDDETGRVLFMEINSMDDIYKRMVALKRVGVKPSTMVLAAHGGKGEISVADLRNKDAKKYEVAMVAGRKLVDMMNKNSAYNKPNVTGYSMQGMKGMARLVEKYMQASRGVDDAADDNGRKKIIFNACYGASEIEMIDHDEAGQEIRHGSQSIISQFGQDLIVSGIGEGVDLYGASTGIQMHRTASGIHYSGMPEGWDAVRPAVKAVRVRLQNGEITKNEVDEIALRRS